MTFAYPFCLFTCPLLLREGWKRKSFYGVKDCNVQPDGGFVEGSGLSKLF